MCMRRWCWRGSYMWDLGLFEGVIGVTLLFVVVFETEDSYGEGILGAEGDVSDEESRLVGQFDQKFANFM